MQIDLSALFESDGKEAQFQVLPQINQFVSKMGVFPIREIGPVRLCVRNVGRRKIEIQGDTALSVCVPCSRCLKEVEVAMPLRFVREARDLPEQAEGEDALDARECLDGASLDVDALLLQELSLAWPYQVLCKPDCKGICAKCGADLNEGDCGCQDAPADLRMAKVLDLFQTMQNMKEV